MLLGNIWTNSCFHCLIVLLKSNRFTTLSHHFLITQTSQPSWTLFGPIAFFLYLTYSSSSFQTLLRCVSKKALPNSISLHWGQCFSASCDIIQFLLCQTVSEFSQIKTDKCITQYLCLCMLSHSVHGILQARLLEWVVIFSSRWSAWPRDQTCISYVSCIGRWILYHCTTWEA